VQVAPSTSNEVGAVSCVILDNDDVKCWGCGAEGGLGIPGDYTNRGDRPGTMGDALQPIPLGTGLKPLKVAVGNGFGCAWLGGNQVKCWGNDFGKPAAMGDQLAPLFLGADIADGTLPITDLVCRWKACCVLATNATAPGAAVNVARCWGDILTILRPGTSVPVPGSDARNVVQLLWPEGRVGDALRVGFLVTFGRMGS
jgi:hypothetical protein